MIHNYLNPPSSCPSLPSTLRFPPVLPRPLRLRHSTLSNSAATGLHPLRVEAAQVAGAYGVTRLGVALLAAEAVLLVLALALGVGAGRVAAAGAGARGLGEFFVNADIEEVGFIGADITGAIF
jgi:hypothetical protein